MARAQHASGVGLRSRGVQAAVGGVLVVAAGAAVWLGARASGSDSRSAPSGPATGSPTASASSPAAAPPSTSAPAALAACARSVQAAEAAVASARSGVEDWTQHVQAYRDVVARAPGAADAPATWDRTAESGPSDAATWSARRGAYTPLRGACTDVAQRAGQAYAPAAQACAARSAAADAAVQAAAPVLQHWSEHLSQSQQRHSGMMSNARANALLAAAARQAPAELAAAQRTRDALAAAPACTA